MAPGASHGDRASVSRFLCLLNAACIPRWSETGQPGADYAKNRESGVTDLELVHLIDKSAKLSDRAGYQQHLNFKLRSPI
jgi:hypothetical protein